MRGIFQGAVWLLALLSLLADSVRRPDVWNTIHFSCESKLEGACANFHVYGDRYIDGPKGREFFQLDNNGGSPRLLVRMTAENITHSDFSSSGIPDLWYYDGFHSKVRDQDIDTETTIIHVVVNSYEKKPEGAIHCQYLATDSRTDETNILRNIVLLPGFLIFEATDAEGISIYDARGDIIPTSSAEGYFQFDTDQIPTRITIPGGNKTIAICSEDLDDLRQRLKFEVEEP